MGKQSMKFGSGQMKLNKEEEALLLENPIGFALYAYLQVRPSATVSECMNITGKARRKTHEMMVFFRAKGNGKGNGKGNAKGNAEILSHKGVDNDLGNAKGNGLGNGLGNAEDPTFQLMKSCFSRSYMSLTSVEYYWQALDHKKLKDIQKKIEFGMRSKGNEITPESVASNFELFLSLISDKWLLDHYSLKNIESQYNNIIASATSKKNRPRERDLQEIERAADAIIAAGKRR